MIMALSNLRVAGIASLAVSMLAFAGPAVADQGTGEPVGNTFGWVPPSTNALNYAKEVPGRVGQTAPYVLFNSNGPGSVTLDFVNGAPGLAFFETRIDGIQTGTTNHPVVGGDKIHTGGTSVPTLTSVLAKQFSATQYVDIRLALGGERDWDFDWHRFYVVPVPTYSCVGFEPPADRDVFVKKPNRVVPLRMTLLDADGMIVYDIDAPVVSVAYSGTETNDTVDLDELNFAGRGDEGNMFAFIGSNWAFNLSTKGLAKGEYTITAVAGSPGYVIDPTCEVVVTIQ